MSPNQPALLSVTALNFSLSKEKHILKDISFSVPQGSFTLLCGPNGSGKSVLLRCIKGLEQMQEGTILLEGKDVTKDRKKRMQTIGLVFQDADTQMVGQTVEKDIRFGMENLGLDLETQTQKLEQRPRTLSGGEKRRLAIAGVLVMDPKLLILDEPFANLDYRSVVSVLSTLLRLQQEGHTIILVSHEVDKTLSHADQVLVLESGHIVASGTPPEVLPILGQHGIYLPEGAAVEDLSWLKR